MMNKKMSLEDFKQLLIKKGIVYILNECAKDIKFREGVFEDVITSIFLNENGMSDDEVEDAFCQLVQDVFIPQVIDYLDIKYQVTDSNEEVIQSTIIALEKIIKDLGKVM